MTLCTCWAATITLFDGLKLSFIAAFSHVEFPFITVLFVNQLYLTLPLCCPGYFHHRTAHIYRLSKVITTIYHCWMARIGTLLIRN